MILPDDFIRYTRELMGDERYARFIAAMDEPPTVSIRLNPLKTANREVSAEWDDGMVPWCHEGHYLKSRPDFTFDPLLHAGAYYVQEASSMFICHVVRSLVHSPVTVLDLCAAPGGKSTAIRAVLPEGSMLYSNEPIRQRASILEENIKKWGHPDVVVTNRYPRYYAESGMLFDMILSDVPCSGEGMFRKDEGAIGEWSVQNVMRCQQLQRDIVTEAWKCLRPGGHLIYSTCTYNAHENEENIAWMIDTFDATPVTIPIEEHWGITGPLTGDTTLPLYRFIPGFTRGEGLCMAVLRKPVGGQETTDRRENTQQKGHRQKAKTSERQNRKDTTPRSMPSNIEVEVGYTTAIAFLRGEAVTLPPDTPRGLVTINYHGLPLGQAKNIGNRANNLYPKAWRIRSQTTHQEQIIII